jgi:O-antigen ligase
MSETGDELERLGAGPPPAPYGLAPLLWGGSLGATVFFLLLGVVVGGLGYTPATLAFTGLLLLAALGLWLGAGLLRGEVCVHGIQALVAVGVLAAALAVAALRAADALEAALKWWLLVGYGLTAFLAMQLAMEERGRRVLTAALLALGPALAVHALWRWAVYAPALRALWRERPDYVLDAMGAARSLRAEAADRLMSTRATGHLVTPNHLAATMYLLGFPLAGAALDGWLEGRSARALVLGLCAALAAAVFVAARSRGAWIGSVLGALVFAWLALGPTARRRIAWLVVLGVPAALCTLAVLSVAAESLAVRSGYWRASLAMVLLEPLFGVGLGSWRDWYAMLKAPEFEETIHAHSVYLELWAEAGTVGLLSLLVAGVAFLTPALRGAAEHGAGPGAQAPPGASHEPPVSRACALGIVGLAAVVLLVEATFVGTFDPPRTGVGALLRSLPALPYVTIWAAWAAGFWLVARGDGGGRCLRVGLWAALGAAAVHGLAEFLLEVPAVGLPAALAVGLLAAGVRHRDCLWRPGRRAAVAAGTATVLVVAGWSSLVVRPAGRHAVYVRRAELAQQLMAVQRRDAAQWGRIILEDYARAAQALPGDDETWSKRAVAELLFGGPARAPQALEHAGRAVRLNPERSANYVTLAYARRRNGDPAGAADALRRAAELHPTLALAWFRYARQAEEAGLSADQACEAYRSALKLLPRQHHPRNRVLGGPEELVAFCRPRGGTEQAAGAAQVVPALVADSVDPVAARVRGLAAQAEDDAAFEQSLGAAWSRVGPRLWELALQRKLAQCRGRDDAPRERR